MLTVGEITEIRVVSTGREVGVSCELLDAGLIGRRPPWWPRLPKAVLWGIRSGGQSCLAPRSSWLGAMQLRPEPAEELSEGARLNLCEEAKINELSQISLRDLVIGDFVRVVVESVA